MERDKKIVDAPTNRLDRIDGLRRKPEISVLIVGGGINGAGVFRDLALQGIDVMLVDTSDFCSGASAAPSRMIHGGLRYLEFGEFRLVRESLKDRNELLKNAPHYVFPLATTIPVFSWFAGTISSIRRFLRLGGPRSTNRGAIMVKLGLTCYDIFTHKNRLMPRHKFASRADSLARRPLLHPGIVRTATYYDAWITYPERLCLELLLDGEQYCAEAAALNYVSLQSAIGDAVVLRDELSGETIEVKPRVVVNATGAWIDLANRRMGRDTNMIGGTKGAHLVLDNEALSETLQGEMIYYETSEGRVSIAFPWLGKALIGSTDIRVENPDEARVTDEEIEYILDSIRQVLPTIDVNRSQVVSYFTGVRPLKSSGASTTVQVSRDHHCAVTEPTEEIAFPVYSLIGGKWTTFRAFAEQVTDKLLEHFGRTRRAGTTGLAIGGGKGFPTQKEARETWLAGLQEKAGLSHERASELCGRYGTRAAAVADFMAEEPDEPLSYHPGYSRREVEFMAREERVERLDDLVLRRTAMALLGELTSELLRELAGIVAAARGWTKETTNEEVDRTAEILRNRYGVEVSPERDPKSGPYQL